MPASAARCRARRPGCVSSLLVPKVMGKPKKGEISTCWCVPTILRHTQLGVWGGGGQKNGERKRERKRTRASIMGGYSCPKAMPKTKRTYKHLFMRPNQMVCLSLPAFGSQPLFCFVDGFINLAN